MEGPRLQGGGAWFFVSEEMNTKSPGSDRVVVRPRVRVEHSATFGGLHVAEVVAPGGLVVPPHRHEAAYVSSLLAGTLTNVDDVLGEAAASGTAFHPLGTTHSSHVGPEGARTLTVEIPSEWLLDRRVVAARGVLSGRDAPQARPLVRRLRRELRQSDPSLPLMLEGLALQLLACLIEASQAATRERAAVRRIKELLRDGMRERWTTEILSRETGVPPRLLTGAFRRSEGCSPGEYLRFVRVQFVRGRLSSGAALAELSAEAGFADQAHCTRVFRETFGVTPGAYRASLRRRALEPGGPGGGVGRATVPNGSRDEEE